MPGPGAYEIGNVSYFKKTAPTFTIGKKLPLPGLRAQMVVAGSESGAESSSKNESLASSSSSSGSSDYKKPKKKAEKKAGGKTNKKLKPTPGKMKTIIMRVFNRKPSSFMWKYRF